MPKSATSRQPSVPTTPRAVPQKRLLEYRARVRRLEALRNKADWLTPEMAEEVDCILALLPNFDELDALVETAGGRQRRTAHQIIRGVADRYGLPIAVVAGRQRHETAHRARAEAVDAIAQACPDLTLMEIGMLFSGRSPELICALREEGRVLRKAAP